MLGPTPARTPLSFTFEDSDSEFDAQMAMPDYEPMSPVVANLEKMVANRKTVPSESGTTAETISSVGRSMSNKRSISSMDSTPPESPIEAFLSRPETPNYPCNNWNSTSTFTMRNGQVYSFGQLQVMSLQIAEARRNGEFPPTTEPTLDANAVAEDYNSLIYLRRLRGNQLAPAPQSYVHFREQVALGIQVRQASLKRETDQEVARRVDHYLQAVEAEQRYYNASNTALQHREVFNPTQQDFIDVHDDMCSMVEHTIEQGISDATGPLRMNVSNLKKQGEVFQEQTALLQHQNDMFQRQTDGLVERQSGLLRQQNNTFQRQSEQQNSLVQQQTSLLRHQTDAFQQQAQEQTSLLRHQTDVFQHQTQKQNDLFQLHADQQNDLFMQQHSMFLNHKASLREHSRFFKKQTDTLEQQNKVMNASVTHLSNLIEPQIYNNQAAAQTLASANQLFIDLSKELPETIRCAVEEASQKQARELIEQALHIQQMASADPQPDAKAISAAQEMKDAAVGSDRAERSERSSIFRMVRKFKRQRISSIANDTNSFSVEILTRSTQTTYTVEPHGKRANPRWAICHATSGSGVVHRGARLKLKHSKSRSGDRKPLVIRQKPVLYAALGYGAGNRSSGSWNAPSSGLPGHLAASLTDVVGKV
ncbi:uncharacterized protein FTJAE_12252 [Fusarium tjaetaba]|uniref:Uncharacterized protein n=1 Tax=Fusarium tjaetaba TaxID=1567544 RepID=A0A8H5QR50_9HYPO|nr:uncharacterized protein FTJAE_12252 [Fusarium tjaetaba]KAF5618321.1 hypothetical protein FTJAE_12252 [Fusarium tjaetaba]